MKFPFDNDTHLALGKQILSLFTIRCWMHYSRSTRRALDSPGNQNTDAGRETSRLEPAALISLCCSAPFPVMSLFVAILGFVESYLSSSLSLSPFERNVEIKMESARRGKTSFGLRYWRNVARPRSVLNLEYSWITTIKRAGRSLINRTDVCTLCRPYETTFEVDVY